MEENQIIENQIENRMKSQNLKQQTENFIMELIFVSKIRILI